MDEIASYAKGYREGYANGKLDQRQRDIEAQCEMCAGKVPEFERIPTFMDDYEYPWIHERLTDPGDENMQGEDCLAGLIHEAARKEGSRDPES